MTSRSLKRTSMGWEKAMSPPDTQTYPHRARTGAGARPLGTKEGNRERRERGSKQVQRGLHGQERPTAECTEGHREHRGASAQFNVRLDPGGKEFLTTEEHRCTPITE